jgi:hypothetical protein
VGARIGGTQGDPAAEAWGAEMLVAAMAGEEPGRRIRVDVTG